MNEKKVRPVNQSRMKSISKWIAIALGTPIILGSAALTYGITLNLSSYNPKIANWLTIQLHRKIEIKGPIELQLSFQPSIALNNVTIANMKGMEWEPMLKVGHLKTQISLFPLLNHTVQIDSVVLNNTLVNLAVNATGQANWDFFPPQTSTTNSSSPFSIALSKHILANNVRVNYDNQKNGAFYSASVNQLSLNKTLKNQWQLQANGDALNTPYDLKITGDLLRLINQQTGQFSIHGQFAGAELNITDAQLNPLQTETSHANVQIKWLNTDTVDQLFELHLSHLTPVTLNSQVEFSANSLNLNQLSIQSPITHGKGHLSVQFGQHNTIQGQLNIPVIDLRPWLQPQPTSSYMMYAAATPPSPLQKALNQWLIKTTTHFSLNVGEIKGLGTPVHSIALDVNGENGMLSAPMTANIANVPFHGNAKINATGWVSHVNVDLEANHSTLGEMAHWLTGIQDAKGQVTSAKLIMSTDGTKLQDWIDNSRIALSIQNAKVNWGAKATFAIDQAKLVAGMNIPFSSNIRGQLMGIPAHIQAHAGTLSDIVQGRDWQANVDFQSPVLTVYAKGLLKNTQWQNGSHFQLSVHSNNVGKLSPWLGTQPSSKGTLNFQGQLDYQKNWITLNVKNMALMDSKGALNLAWLPSKGQPFVKLNGQFHKLNITQLAKFVDSKTLPKVNNTVPTQGVNLNAPLLTHSITIADADVALSVEKLQWLNQTLNQLHFDGTIRNGEMTDAPFAMSYAGSKYTGQLALGLANTNLSARLQLNVNHPNVGEILHQFHITNALAMHLDRAQLALSLSGKTVLELMENASLSAKLEGGQLQLPNVYTGKALNINLASGTLSTGPKNGTLIDLTGKAQALPVHITLKSASLKQVNNNQRHIPISLNMALGSMRFHADSTLSLPINMKALSLSVSAYLPNLNQLDPFMGLKLPPYGPVNVKATLSTNQRGYHLRNLVLTVNHSQLKGKGDFLPPLAPDQRPYIDLKLNAPFIQINDFKLKNWHAWLPESKKDTQTPSDQSNHNADMISPAGLNLFNGLLDANVGEVRSGNDWLGEGHLNMTLKNGLLTLHTLDVKVPGGNVHIEGSLKPLSDKFNIHLKGKVKNFDYGILARRLDPTTKMRGLISTQFNLTSIANTPDSLLNNASGFLGFAVWPKAYQANLIDLWAVSLTDAIIPNFIHHDNSVVNCVAAGLNIHHGVMTQRQMLLDTSRIQVHGQFRADYADKSFNLYLTPQSKTPQIFSLQTPVQIAGHFTHFNFSVPLKAILETSVRFTTSPVVTPIRWLIDKPIPKNDSQVCQQILQGYS